MTSRKQKILLSATLLLGGLLLGAQIADSAPVSLNDHAMDEVTAGNTAEGGGVVVGNSSKAVISRTDGINLSGEAQRGAKGLNIVNSTESAVANTTNIWEGGGVTAAGEGHNTDSEVVINKVRGRYRGSRGPLWQ
jgi:hypothetical protein